MEWGGAVNFGGGGLPTVTDLVERRARNSPEADAILAPGGEPPLSYGALWDQVLSVSQSMRALGIRRGDRVAVILDNGPEMGMLFTGLASSVVCAPLNPSYREAEIEFYLSDLAPRALIIGSTIESSARDIARRQGIRVVELSKVEEAPAGTFVLEDAPSPSRELVDPAQPEDVALVLHTSGTTSRPKLVPLTHRNLVASARNVATALKLGEADRCLNVMPLFHIHGLVASVLAPLYAGAGVVCPPGFDSRRFFSWMAKTSPTWFTAVPTIHQAILARAEDNRVVIETARLRFIRSSSSALAPQVLAQLENVFGVPVIEAYGMTEAAHQMASNPLPPGVRKPGAVGLAAGPEVAILDGSGRVLPAGSEGEVAVRGDNIFGAYENNLTANDSAFCDGWFRTGDEGCLDEDGYLFLRGRIKEIINRGGEKVSPREVDEVLLGHAAVAQAVTFAVPNDRVGEEVAAAIVLRDGATITEDELREYAAHRLIDFKVPRQILFVDEIPMGPTGKVQRTRLAETLGISGLHLGKTSADSGYVAPRTQLEHELCLMWAEILDLPQVGIGQDFFALGGDSLLGAQLFVALGERFGKESVPLTALIAAPTIEKMAVLLEQGGFDAPFDFVVPIQPEGDRPPFFLVHTNVIGFMGLAERLDTDQPLYGIQLLTADGLPPPYERLEEMAADLLAEIRTVQPDGPYLVGGVCTGATVALEIARRLREDDDEVALIALIDPVVGRKKDLRYFANRARWHARQGGLTRVLGRHLVQVVRRSSRVPRTVKATSRGHMANLRDSYVVTKHPGPMNVFLSAEREFTTRHDTYEALTSSRVNWHTVPGLHEAMLREPAVNRLGEELDQVLRKAQQYSGISRVEGPT